MEPIRIELPTFFEKMTVNTWLFLEPEPTLIDCGEKTDACWKALVAGLAQHSLTIQDIKKVIITHGHIDHIGMANKITQHSDAMIWVNDLLYDWTQELELMLDRRMHAIMKVMRPRLPEKHSKRYADFGYKTLAPFWENIPKERVKKFPINGYISIGGSNWEVIYTPGHCINQTCFYNPQNGHFLSADMLLRIIPVPIIDAHPEIPYGNVPSLEMHLQSYKKISSLNITKVFPGHFTAFEQAQDLIDTQVKKIHARKEKCFELIQKGHDELLDLVHNIYPKRLNDATIFMVVGFLELLEKEGRIAHIEENGRFKYYEKISVI